MGRKVVDTKIISFGGGINSIAMVIMLYEQNEIYPCVFADTLAEHPETYCYMDYFEKEFMSKYGQKIIRLSPINSKFHYPYARRSLEGYLLEKKRVPATFGGYRACTTGWKREPIQRFSKGKKQLIAFAFDEQYRAKDLSHGYPLIDRKITRQECIRIIREAKLFVPPKSSCFFCSFQRIAQWEELYRKHPDLYTRAVKLEENTNRTIRPDGIPLQILKNRFDGKSGDLFNDCDFEELTPCLCTL